MVQSVRKAVRQPRGRPHADPVGADPGLLRALVRAARPRQWIKNLLLLAAPTAAGSLASAGALARLLPAVLIFCAASSGVYLLNDLRDADADRLHPVKRHRPIAAGHLGVAAAATGAAVLMAGALTASALALPWTFTLALVGYLALTISYSLWLKHIAVVDIVVVAGGFVIRAVAGGLAVGVPLSSWFLLVATFGALFVVVGKRHAEVAELGVEADGHRATLASYTPAFTSHLLTLSSSVCVVGYCLWAAEAGRTGSIAEPWPALSVLPFAMVLLRYALVVFSGRGGEPEDIVLSDRQLQIFGAVWLLSLMVGIYA